MVVDVPVPVKEWSVQCGRVGQPVLHVVVGDGRLAGHRRGRPRHVQLGRRRRGVGDHRRRGNGGRLGNVRNVNRDRDDVVARRVGVQGEALGIRPRGRRRHRYRYAVRSLGFVVQVRTRLHGNLPGAAAYLKLARVRSAQGMGQGVVVGVGGNRHRGADVGVRRRVLGDVAGYGGRTGRHRYADAGGRPGAVALIVGGQHLHLVGLARSQTAQVRAGGGPVKGCVSPGTIPRQPVLHVVIRNGRLARHIRCRPAHIQLALRRRAVDRNRGRGRPGRRLVHVRHVDGHRGRVVYGIVRSLLGVLAVGYVHLHRVGGLGFVVGNVARLDLDLAGGAVDGEACPCPFRPASR